jgi:hypothetical protein
MPAVIRIEVARMRRPVGTDKIEHGLDHKGLAEVMAGSA